MDLLSVGLSHKRAPVEVREKLWFSPEEIREALKELSRQKYAECVIASTCNRTEVYVVSPSLNPSADALRDFLVEFKSARRVARPKHFYSFLSCGVANHLFEVASGMDSMVVGDSQILGQVREAFKFAQEEGTNGLFTNRLFQTALHVGKRVRTETEISDGAVSVSSAAVELAAKIFERLEKKSALLIGAGKTGELTAKHLISKGVQNVIIANRTQKKAQELVRRVGGSVVDFTEMKSRLRSVDIVISSVSSSDYVLTVEDLRDAMRGRENNPLIIIDIGVPRNVDPDVNSISNVFLHDIDALQRIVDQNLEKRARGVSKARLIVGEALVEFTQWYNSLSVNPTIHELRDLFEEIRRLEVEKNTHRFSEHDRDLIDIVTKRIVNKILHIPTANLKNGNPESTEETLAKVETIRKLFGLAGQGPLRGR